MGKTYISYCQKHYQKHYNEYYASKLGKKTSDRAKTSAIRHAQLNAIKDTFEDALKKYYPDVSPADLWDTLYSNYVAEKSKITKSSTLSTQIVRDVISADQSWRKSSGHAFEAFIAERANKKLKKANVTFILQKDLTKLIKKGLIKNEEDELNWIKHLIKTGVFDLYAIGEIGEDKYVFGCIQCKTSIRDRVKSDREPSMDAMKNGFWSIAVTLDGAFLTMPKFQEMVNGKKDGKKVDKKNGWHAMYVMSNSDNCGRIQSVDLSLSDLTSDAQRAYQDWVRLPKRLSHDWTA